MNVTCVLQDHEEDVVPVREESMTFRDSNRPVLGAGSAGGQFLSKIVSVESDELCHLLSHDVRGLQICPFDTSRLIALVNDLVGGVGACAATLPLSSPGGCLGILAYPRSELEVSIRKMTF